jgi:hypothetical protein
MSHTPVFTVLELAQRIREEAEELATEPKLNNVFVELIDVFGWLEAASQHLAAIEKVKLASELVQAASAHRAKCVDRGLKHLPTTYTFIDKLARSLVEEYFRKRQHDLNYRNRLKAAGLCPCGANALPGRVRCELCLKKHASYEAKAKRTRPRL